MSFVVTSGNKQFIADYGQKLIVDRLNSPIDSIIDLPVLFDISINEEKSPETLKAQVVAHTKGEKLRVVKFRAKSTYHRQYGPRQSQTLLVILDKDNTLPEKKKEETKAEKSTTKTGTSKTTSKKDKAASVDKEVKSNEEEKPKRTRKKTELSEETK